jgi:hypothetical protein
MAEKPFFPKINTLIDMLMPEIKSQIRQELRNSFYDVADRVVGEMVDEVSKKVSTAIEYHISDDRFQREFILRWFFNGEQRGEHPKE